MRKAATEIFFIKFKYLFVTFNDISNQFVWLCLIIGSIQMIVLGPASLRNTICSCHKHGYSFKVLETLWFIVLWRVTSLLVSYWGGASPPVLGYVHILSTHCDEEWCLPLDKPWSTVAVFMRSQRSFASRVFLLFFEESVPICLLVLQGLVFLLVMINCTKLRVDTVTPLGNLK